MTDEALVREFLHAWERRDVDALLVLSTEDAVWHHLPLAPIEGTEQITAFIEKYADIPGGPYEILRAASGGGFVFTERYDHVTNAGKLWPLPVCGVFEVRDGKVAAWRDYYDTSPMILASLAGNDSAE